MTTLGKWAWHVHHEQLVERLTKGGLTARRKYIQENKPESEVETRLRLLKPVRDQTTMGRISKDHDKAVVSAGKTFNEVTASAWKAYIEARASTRKVFDEARASARKAYDEAVASARKALDKATAPFNEAVGRLHRRECKNCPWDGETIFP